MLERHAAAALPEVKTRLLPEGGYEELTVSGGPPKEYSWRDEENALIENVLRDAQSGDIGAARQTLDEMHVAGYGFRTRAYSYVIKALVQSGHGLAAVELAAEGLRPIHEYERLTVARVGALAELAVEVARLDSGLAMDLLQQGIALASGLEDRQLKFEACHELACARLKVVGMFDLQEFIRTVIGSDDEPARGPIGVSLCRLLAESDRVEAALQLAEELPEPFWFTSFRNEAYQTISRARAAIGDLQQAVTVADRITIYTWERTVEGVSLAARAGALAGIVVASAGAGQTSEAERAYAEIIANGSGTEGALDEWHGWLHEAFSALLLHFFETGRGDKLDDLTRGEENLISGPDAASIGRAARFIGDGNRDAAVTQLLDIGDPTWRGKALCKLAQRASRSGSGEVLGLARLAFECATEEEYSAARLHLLGEISALIESLGDAEVESNVTGLFDHVAAGLTGDRTASLSLALRTSLAYWKPSQLQGLLAEAAEWPSAAYEACVLLARRYRGTETKIAQLVLLIDARRLSRLAGRAVDVLPERG
jgi:hypothetical protein